MSLIECPECGTMVSENAEKCPSCGNPTHRFISYCPYCELLRHKKILMNFSKETKIFTCPECNKTMGFSTPEQEAKWAEQRRIEELQNDNKVTCPYCHSTNVLKIGTGERVASIIGLGIFSKKINKSFKCKNCGGTF